jgi:hypothetical protein
MIKSGSPDCSIGRTFIYKFYFLQKVTKVNQIARIYQNPIYLANEYKRMIDNGQAKNQSDLARKLELIKTRFLDHSRIRKAW